MRQYLCLLLGDLLRLLFREFSGLCLGLLSQDLFSLPLLRQLELLGQLGLGLRYRLGFLALFLLHAFFLQLAFLAKGLFLLLFPEGLLAQFFLLDSLLCLIFHTLE